jgi:hypothetical protein
MNGQPLLRLVMPVIGYVHFGNEVNERVLDHAALGGSKIGIRFQVFGKVLFGMA